MNLVADHVSAGHPFVHESLATRVLFGWGVLARLPEEIDRLGGQRILVLTTPAQRLEAQHLVEILGSRVAALFTEAAMHTPVEVTERALAVASAHRIDVTLALGGGSTTGLGKAIAVRTGVAQIVIPTTYAGSEMTPILGETADGLKTTRRSPDIQPEVVLYDPALTLSLPATLSATSGLNAIAHAAEGLYANGLSPVVGLMAEEGIRALGAALPVIAHNLRDRDARSLALYGAWLCGATLGSVGMALHHKLCHVLGGSFDLPHAETHAVVLPHAIAYNAPAAPAAMQAIERALGRGPAAMAIERLADCLGVPRSLRALGMPREGIDRAVELVLSEPYWNPRPVERESLHKMLEDAWEGRSPRAHDT